MTFGEAYASLKAMYKNLMFPENPQAQKWTMTEVDQLDVHFFYELMVKETKQPETQRYINDVF